jgi:ATP-binding cassette subfamily F protein uup
LYVHCSRYLATTAALHAAAAPPPRRAAAAAPARAQPPRPAAPRKRTFKEQQELAAIEQTIEAAEGEVTALEAALQDPTAYAQRATEVPAMVAALEAARRRVEQLYARWQELETIPDRA